MREMFQLLPGKKKEKENHGYGVMGSTSIVRLTSPPPTALIHIYIYCSIWISRRSSVWYGSSENNLSRDLSRTTPYHGACDG